MNVRLVIIALVLCTRIFGAADDTAARCRRLLTFMVQHKRVMNADDLAAFLAAPKGSNPALFVTTPTATERLPFERAFQKALSGEEADTVWNVLQDQARLLLESETRAAQNRAVAEVSTEALPLPILRKELDFPERPYGPPLVFTHAGKSFGAFGIGRDQMLIVDLESLAMRAVALDGPHPVSGRPRYLAAPGLIAFTGATSNNRLSKKGLGFVDPLGGTAPAPGLPADKIVENAIDGLHTYEHDGKTYLVTIDHPEGALAIVPIGGGPDRVKRFAAELADITPAVFTAPGESPLVAVKRNDGKGLRIVDPIGNTEQALDPKVDFDSFSFFPIAGKPRLLLTGKAGAFTVDPTTKIAEPISGTLGASSSSRPFVARGVMRAAVVIKDMVVIVNLEDRTTSAPVPAVDISMAPRYVATRDRELIVWGNKEGVISIVDIERPDEIIHKQIVAGSIKDIVPFVTAHGVDAIVTRTGSELPYVAQLFGPAKKETH